MAQTKNKTQQNKSLEIKTRKPKKKDADIFGNLGNSTKSTLTEIHPIAEMLSETSEPTQPTPPTQLTQPTSPARNFSKVSNSITKAIGEKLFKGLSKQTYDVLYSKTRGAIKPSRIVTVTKKELIQLTGFSDNTLSKHLIHLKKIGLVIIDLNMGKHSGSTYEVLTPDELHPTHPTQSTHTTSANPPQKVVPNPPQKVVSDGYSKPKENKGTYEFPKTSFKDYKYIDDETLAAFLKMIDKFSEISEKLTGKKPNKYEVDTWDRLGDLLISELLKANDKADSISNIPAFLTEVLRRKLVKKAPPQNKTKLAKTKSEISRSQITKDDPEDYTDDLIKDLPKEELEETLGIFLKNLREEEGFENLIFAQEQLYTETDWKWIAKRLGEEGFESPVEK